MTISNSQTKCYGADHKTSPHSIRASTVIHSRVVSRNCTHHQLAIWIPEAPSETPELSIERVPLDVRLAPDRWQLVIKQQDQRFALPIQLTGIEVLAALELCESSDVNLNLDEKSGLPSYQRNIENLIERTIAGGLSHDD